MGLKVGTVKLVNYTSNWKKLFADEAKNLKDIFENIAISIDHIGSTAIEGLSAKPIIDIAVAVKSLDDFNLVKEKIEKAGNYSIKDDSAVGEILVRKGSEANRTHFIHVMEYGGERYKDTMLFKKYLENHFDAKNEYEILKKRLVSKYYNDRKMYTAGKNDFINNILRLAKEEYSKK